MAAFLTQEWANEVTSALGASEQVRGAIGDVELTIQQIVTGGASGETHYWTKLGRGSVTIGIGDASDADITMTQDYDTACAQNRGELLPQAAFMQGKLKITGNMAKLLRNQEAVSALQPVLASVPTDY
jgi:putative sterol carrier protein